MYGKNIKIDSLEGGMIMQMYDVIKHKRDGEELTEEEIRFMISGYMKEEIPDYQMAAFLMAVYFKGMNEHETLLFTRVMADTGATMDLSKIHGIKVDKHSTGGVGDKTTLILAPMVAACGVPIAKMSGRGLGHTGGTIDKLESFPGFSTTIPLERFIHNVNTNKIAIAGQTTNLAPADKKLYALRDVTATVDSMSLIASSIMSKKLASGADVIVLDVKLGSGAFMKTKEDAFTLAEEMVKIGNGAGKKTVAVISDMDQPLGYTIGNALEVKEAIETLKGNGPKDLTELCITLGSHMLVCSDAAPDVESAKELLWAAIADNRALNKLAELVRAQGGDERAVYDTSLLPSASIQEPLFASCEGFLIGIDAEEVGMCSLLLGGGRKTKESVIDLSVGIVFEKKTGDHVQKGEVLAIIHGNCMQQVREAKERLENACQIGSSKPQPRSLIWGVVAE